MAKKDPFRRPDAKVWLYIGFIAFSAHALPYTASGFMYLSVIQAEAGSPHQL